MRVCVWSLSAVPLRYVQALEIVSGLHAILGREVYFSPLTPTNLAECINVIERVMRRVTRSPASSPLPSPSAAAAVAAVRVVVCGGDGSVGWVVSEVAKAGLAQLVAIGIIPVGTGNDLSITMGWGSYSFGSWFGECSRAVPQHCWFTLWCVDTRLDGVALVRCSRAARVVLQCAFLLMSVAVTNPPPCVPPDDPVRLNCRWWW